MAVIGMRTGVLARPVPSLDVTAQSEDEINDKNWQKHPTIIAIRRIVNSPMPKSGVARSRLSTESVRRAGLVDFESPVTQRGPSDGTSIIRRAKTRPGTIISTTTMRVVCGLC